MKNKEEDILSLIEQNWSYMHLCKFFADLARQSDLSSQAKDITVTRHHGLSYVYRKETTAPLLKDIFEKQLKPSLVDYFATSNGVRGIMMALYEGFKVSHKFCEFVNGKLRLINEDHVRDFKDITAFLRHVLSHNVDDNIALQHDDYKDIKRRRESINSKAILDINYDKILAGAGHPRGYSFKIEVDFNSLDGRKLTDIISDRNLLMLCEFSRNLVLVYKATVKT